MQMLAALSPTVAAGANIICVNTCVGSKGNRRTHLGKSNHRFFDRQDKHVLHDPGYRRRVHMPRERTLGMIMRFDGFIRLR